MEENNDEPWELNRSPDPELLTEEIDVLKNAGIWHDLYVPPKTFDLTDVANQKTEATVLRVKKVDFGKAQSLIQDHYSKVPLPDDHFLHDSTDDELAEIVSNDSEWGLYDVAHTKRMLNERGVDPATVEEKKKLRIETLKKGNPASVPLLAFGWGAALFWWTTALLPGPFLIVGLVCGVGWVVL